MSTASLQAFKGAVFPSFPGEPKRAFPRHPATGLTEPIHYWAKAMQWSVIFLLFTTSIYLIEHYAIGLVHQKHANDMGRSAARDPGALAAMVFGYAHYFIATFFLFTSKKIRSAKGLALLAVFTIAGLAICHAFHLAGGQRNRLALIAIFIFFLIHGLRDEVFFYRQRAGKALTDEEYPHVYRMLMFAQAFFLFLLASVLYPVFIYGFWLVHGHAQVQQFVDSLLPETWTLKMRMFATAAPFLLLAAATWWKLQTLHPGGLAALLRSHSPVAIILGGYFFFAVLIALFGMWIINVLILMHFVGWFLFAADDLHKKALAGQQLVTWRQPNQWIRRNYVGFCVFHLGLVALFFGMVAANHWVFANEPVTIGGTTMPNLLSALSDRETFAYCTILHITLGFMPKPAPARR